ncbi:MAG: undecaprenyldiphospho-muramoylpentapeptide beta-N-acetylglucosaminyltransferase [Patescibacteria group bacterium]
MKILFSGGGTMGSVMPLLAIKDALQNKNAEFFWIGTKNGPEREVIEKSGIRFYSIHSGKLRRYFSLATLIAPVLLIAGVCQSLRLILKFKPDIILAAGGYVGVPVVWAGWMLRKKIIVHQQDLIVGLANKLMTPLADKITVSLEEQKKCFPQNKVVVTGNPVRKMIFQGSKDSAIKRFGLLADLPTILVMGGGTGALAINKLIRQLLPELVRFCQIIHLTGPGKKLYFQHRRYHSFEFLNQELADAFAAADLVISRAGFSALTELAALAKPVILIPLPNDDQLSNARYFETKKAAEIFDQEKMTGAELLKKIKTLLSDSQSAAALSGNIGQIMSRNAGRLFVDVINNL